MKPLKQILKGALCFLPFVCLVVFVNWYGDPANVLRTGYEKQVASILVRGENASNIRNMDDRLFMKIYADMRTKPVDTLVLGSSHCMQITTQLTGDPNTFAAGVTGADLRDCISIYRLFRDEGFSPKRVILAADFWFMSEGTLEKRAMTEGYQQFCAEHGLTALSSSKWDLYVQALEKKGQAFSLPYFQTSLDYIKKGLQSTRDPVSTTEFYTAADMRRADGSYCYNEELRIVTPDSTKDRAINYIVAKPQNARDFTGISADLKAQFETFLDELQAAGIEVAILIPPFHPDYYTYMTTQTDNYVDILATEDVVRQMAQVRDIPVFGSYDPEACGLSATDFYDGVHCSDTAMYKFYPDDLFR